MNVPVFMMSWRALWRDWRSGDLWMLAVSVVLAVAAMTTVGFFSDRLKSGLQRDAKQLLGGDAVVVADNPLPSAFVAQAQTLGLSTVQTLSFPTMARAPDQSGGAARLVSLKAVAPGYPLRGRLLLDPSSKVADLAQPGIPAVQTVWVDASLLQALGLQLGDALWVGDSAFVIAAVIASEPDRGAGFANFAPRVMMNSADLAATRLVQPASRLTYRLSVASHSGSASAQALLVKRYEEWVNTQLVQTGDNRLKGVRLESLATGRPEMTQTLSRATSFLSLVALLAALLGAVALALAARNFANRHLDTCAVLRVMGVSQRQIAAMIGLELAWVGLLACGLGVLLALGGQAVLVSIMGPLLMAQLPQPSVWPMLTGFGVGMVLLMAFGIAPVLQMAAVTPLRVIRKDLGSPQPAFVLSLITGLAGMVGLLVLTLEDVQAGAIVLGGFALAGGLFFGLGYCAVRLLGLLRNRTTGATWLNLALRQISSRPGHTAIQVGSLALGLMAMVLLVLLRTDLVDSWRAASSANAPDRFVINVMPDQTDAFQHTVQQGGAQLVDWYPMFRGRLIQINDKNVGPDDFQDDRAKRLVDREFNLSNSATLPAHNQLVGGRWVNEEPGTVSMEVGIAKTLGLQLGDRLVFDLGGITSAVKVTSLRKVDWSSMRANFFALLPVAVLKDVPQTFMGTLKVPQASTLDNQLVKSFPNITLVDMRQTVAQIQGVLNQVITAVELLFVLSVLAGALVVVTTVISSRETRVREYAIMRALGARQGLLARVQRVELALVGLLAGGLASLAATAIAWAMATYVFEFEWTVSWLVLLGGTLMGMPVSLMAGTLALRGVVKRPVVQTLRESL